MLDRCTAGTFQPVQGGIGRHICTGTALTHDASIYSGTGPTPATSAPGLGSHLTHLHRDWAHPCMAGTFQPDDGGIGCLSCDILGDYVQEYEGASACELCPLHTRRYVALSGANKTSCSCKEGAFHKDCQLR
jgi:hypothetical protein